jgi:hypothetical protein
MMSHMSVPQVWVSTTAPTIQFDDDGPGKHWELVGTIDTTQESAFHKHIQHMLGIKNAPRAAAEFYLDGDPASAWVKSADRAPFWIAIDPYGTMWPHIHGAELTYFVSNARATVTPLVRRAPEAHPGAIVRPVKIPIRLKRTEAGYLAKSTEKLNVH